MKLWRYIQGNRKGKEAHDIEKEAMSDPFLADALEGYEKTKGNHQREVTKLQKKIKRRQQYLTDKSLGKKSNRLKAWSIAASILIAAGVGTWFLLTDSLIEKDRYAVEVTMQEEAKPIAHSPSPKTMPDTTETASGNLPMAQVRIPTSKEDDTKEYTTKEDAAIVASAPQQTSPGESESSEPRPIIGMEAYMGYIQRNLKRPTDDECRNAKGPVIVAFKIGQSGRPYNIRVTQGLCSSSNEEAIRLIIHGPGWKKGSDSDETTITIHF